MEAFYHAAVWQARSHKEIPAILDFGAGTGLLAALLLHKYSRTRITLMDFSESMLSAAKKRFAMAPHINYLVADYSTGVLPQGFDLVVSALSVHPLPDIGKKELFGQIHAVLEPGGIFVNADQILGETDQEEHDNLEFWMDFLLHRGLSAKGIEESRQRRRLDQPERLSDQLLWLKEAEFSNVQVAYKHFTFVVYSGQKGAK